MAVSAKDSKLLEQKDLISQLNTTIAAFTKFIVSSIASAVEHTGHLYVSR